VHRPNRPSLVSYRRTRLSVYSGFGLLISILEVDSMSGVQKEGASRTNRTSCSYQPPALDLSSITRGQCASLQLFLATFVDTSPDIIQISGYVVSPLIYPAQRKWTPLSWILRIPSYSRQREIWNKSFARSPKI
jgi:hypothetical protein